MFEPFESKEIEPAKYGLPAGARRVRQLSALDRGKIGDFVAENGGSFEKMTNQAAIGFYTLAIRRGVFGDDGKRVLEGMESDELADLMPMELLAELALEVMTIGKPAEPEPVADAGDGEKNG